MEAQQQFDKIEAYLAGELTGATLAAFEQEIQTNAALAAEVEEHRIAQDAIEFLIEDDLRKELDLLREEAAVPATATPKVVQMPKRATAPAAQGPTTGKRRSLFPRLAAAASVILLIGFFTLQYNSSSSSDGLSPVYPMPEVNRSGEVTEVHPLAEGIVLYKAEKYTEAITYYQSIPATDKRYNEAQFYLGHSYYNNKEYKAASSTFEKLVQRGDIRFLEKAEWYQLLSLLANQQQDSTFTSLLNKMLNDAGLSYHQQAQELNADL